MKLIRLGNLKKIKKSLFFFQNLNPNPTWIVELFTEKLLFNIFNVLW
jgi:hypothetical protein